ncbi:hypothetical protein BUZ11_11725 [Staphylococcus gallinarum]|nr:hypothetical protein BUZ09_10020 [Staphylococcus gallinarum]PTL11793.1 hypothetical protein BUZ15_01840 [Staphylococcus gallinarum]RIL33278.1 hypothetical protein BUY98_07910 [Staphylococcus gallinarum]RIO75550.1 hypothetical protein BUZ12_10765 [Staphylococcus gallinarum]RIO81248.1 hypothetical protein BUZ11_11725 [Staphylococcus gallinarum]
MIVEIEFRPSPLGKQAMIILSIDINNKPIKDLKSLMGLMLGIYLPVLFNIQYYEILTRLLE